LTFAGALSRAAAPRSRVQAPEPDRQEPNLADRDQAFLAGRGESFTAGRSESFHWSSAFAPAGAGTEADTETDTDTDHDSDLDSDIGSDHDSDLRTEMDTDTASFSYESALRAAIRFPLKQTDSLEPDEWSQSGAQPEETGQDCEQAAEQATASDSTGFELRGSESPGSELGTARRSASVTIRLSASECAQLKQRAAEAGLTLSAYVRSCTFEAEALRAQVKQAIKELRGELDEDLRAPSPLKKPPAPQPSPLSMADTDTDARRSWWQLRSSQKNFSAQT
jgi:predicted DNA binding CopG/RHH family protein